MEYINTIHANLLASCSNKTGSTNSTPLDNALSHGNKAEVKRIISAYSKWKSIVNNLPAEKSRKMEEFDDPRKYINTIMKLYDYDTEEIDQIKVQIGSDIPINSKMINDILKSKKTCDGQLEIIQKLEKEFDPVFEDDLLLHDCECPNVMNHLLSKDGIRKNINKKQRPYYHTALFDIKIHIVKIHRENPWKWKMPNSKKEKLKQFEECVELLNKYGAEVTTSNGGKTPGEFYDRVVCGNYQGDDYRNYEGGNSILGNYQSNYQSQKESSFCVFL